MTATLSHPGVGVSLAIIPRMDDPLAVAYGPRPKVCMIDGCDRRHYARGWCKPHYRKAYNAGTLAPLDTEPALDKFNRLHVVEPGGCWRWTGPLTTAGYGVLCTGAQQHPAHRWAYEHFVGPIPDGLDLDHLCHNADTACPGGAGCRHRACCNPDHVEPATRKENLNRSHVVTARAEVCASGHLLSGDNLYVTPGGRNRCRQCDRDRGARYRARRRAETENQPIPVCDCGRPCKAWYSTKCHRCAMSDAWGRKS